MKNKYIKEIEELVQKAEWNLGYTKHTLENGMENETKEEKAKVQASIDQQEVSLNKNKDFLAWLKNQK